MTISNYNNKLLFKIFNPWNNNSSYITDNIYFDNNWHHVVWGIDTNNVWTIYIDNILYSPNITLGLYYMDLPPSSQINIGGNQFDINNTFNGFIADFRMYMTVLSQDLINKLYNFQGKSSIIKNIDTTTNTIVNTNNNIGDISSWVNFDFNNISFDFPLHISGNLLLDSSLSSDDINLLQNGPNVGGTSLVNGYYDIPILVKFHD